MDSISKSRMRRFVLERTEDVSGTSGTGIVAEGCQFTNGYVALTWMSPYFSLGTYHSMDVLLNIHGHGSKTKTKWIDPPLEG